MNRQSPGRREKSLTFSLGQTPDEMAASIREQIGRINAELYAPSKPSKA